MSVPTTPLNRLRQLWREGRPAFGAIATIPSVQTVQIMARSLDWIIVDLATSIDKRGQMDDPELLELVARAEAGILRSGVPIGGVARTADQANALVDRGYRAVALGFDWSLFQRGIMAAFEGIKR